MKLYVPEIGDNLELTKDWVFKLYTEERNETLGKTFGYDLKYVDNKYVKDDEPFNWLNYHRWVKEDTDQEISDLMITLKESVVLVVDRIYIRKGAKEFSSISFFVKGLPKIKTKPKYAWHTPQLRPVRFWARLSDCNNINFKLVE